MDINQTSKTNGNQRVLLILGAGLCVLSVVLFGARALSSETIDAQGFLQESFYLVPLGYMALAGGVVSLVLGLLWKRLQGTSRNK